MKNFDERPHGSPVTEADYIWQREAVDYLRAVAGRLRHMGLNVADEDCDDPGVVSMLHKHQPSPSQLHAAARRIANGSMDDQIVALVLDWRRMLVLPWFESAMCGNAKPGECLDELERLERHGELFNQIYEAIPKYYIRKANGNMKEAIQAVVSDSEVTFDAGEWFCVVARLLLKIRDGADTLYLRVTRREAAWKLYLELRNQARRDETFSKEQRDRMSFLSQAYDFDPWRRDEAALARVRELEEVCAQLRARL